MIALLVLVLTFLPPGVPPIPAGAAALTLPPEIHQPANGDPVCLKPVTVCKRVTWKVPPGLWCDASDDGLKFQVRSATAGRFSLIAAVPQGDGVCFAECVLIVGDDPKPPPGPGPAPPGPAPPTPVDPLIAELQALYAADAKTDPTAPATLGKLVEFYVEALDLARSASADTTCGQLIAAIVAVRDKQVPAGSLPTLRARLGKELAKLPAPELTLDNACKAAVVAKFEALAKALAAVK